MNNNCNMTLEQRKKGLLCRGMFCEPCKKQRELNNKLNNKPKGEDYIDKLGYTVLSSTDGNLWLSKNGETYIHDSKDKVYFREDIDEIRGKFSKVSLEEVNGQMVAIETYIKEVPIHSIREYFLRFGPFLEDPEDKNG